MQILPIRDRIVVKRNDEMKQTTSGLFIPDSSTEKPDQGVVIAVGTGKILPNGTILPMEVEVGNTVVFAKNSGYPVKIDNVEYVTLKEDDLIAVLK